MSRKTIAKHSVILANSKLGGARITKLQRKRICVDLLEWCFANGYPFNTFAGVTKEMVDAYILSLRDSGISVASLHNRVNQYSVGDGRAWVCHRTEIATFIGLQRAGVFDGNS